MCVLDNNKDFYLPKIINLHLFQLFKYNNFDNIFDVKLLFNNGYITLMYFESINTSMLVRSPSLELNKLIKYLYNLPND